MSEPISADVTAAAPTHPPAAAQVYASSKKLLVISFTRLYTQVAAHEAPASADRR